MKDSRISLLGGPGCPAFARSLWLPGDAVGPGVADSLADHGDPVLPGQRPTRAHQRPRGMNLPPEPGHDLFERRAFGSPEHLDQLGGLAGRAGSVPGGLWNFDSLRERFLRGLGLCRRGGGFSGVVGAPAGCVNSGPSGAS